MKICLISSNVLPTPPPAYGGSEVVVHNLAQGLHALGHGVTVVAHKDSPPQAWRVENIADIGDWNTWLESEKFDIIHDHGWEFIGWQWAARHPGDHRAIQTWHGPELSPRVRWMPPPENLTLVGISYNHSALLAMQAGGRPVETVYNGVNLDAYPLYLGPRDRPPLVLARLDPVKGQYLTLDLPQVEWAGTEHLVGDPDYVRWLIAQADGRRIVWWGDVGGETKVHLIQHAQAILWGTPNYEEPFGLGLVESMACGTPVIALNRGGIGEIVPGGGILTGSLIEWMATVKQLIRGDLTLPDPTTCRENAARFTADRMVEHYAALYAKITAKRGEDHGHTGDVSPNHVTPFVHPGLE